MFLGVFNWVVFLASSYFLEVTICRIKLLRVWWRFSGSYRLQQVLAYAVLNTFSSSLQPRLREQLSLQKDLEYGLRPCTITRVGWPHQLTKLWRIFWGSGWKFCNKRCDRCRHSFWHLQQAVHLYSSEADMQVKYFAHDMWRSPPSHQ